MIAFMIVITPTMTSIFMIRVEQSLRVGYNANLSLAETEEEKQRKLSQTPSN